MCAVVVQVVDHRLWFWIRPPGFESWVGANIIWSFDHCTGLIPEPSSLRGSTMGTRAAEPVTGTFKLIDGCSLKLCSATPLVVSSGRNKVNSTSWLSCLMRSWFSITIFASLYVMKSGVLYGQRFSQKRLPENWNSFHYVVCLQQQVFSGSILPEHTFK